MTEGTTQMVASKTNFNTPPSTPAGNNASNNTTGGNILTKDQKAESEAANIFGKPYFSSIQDEYEPSKIVSNLRLDQIREDEKRARALQGKGSIQFNTRAVSRGTEKFVTQNSATDLDLFQFDGAQLENLDLGEILKQSKRNANISRRSTNLIKGHFSEEGQPYKTLGTVYTNTSDLIKSGLMDDVLNKMRKNGNGANVAGIRRLQKSSQGTRPTSRSQTARKLKISPSCDGMRRASSEPRKDSVMSEIVEHGDNIPSDSAGINLIRDQLQLSGKMRTNVSGTLDLSTALDHRNNGTGVFSVMSQEHDVNHSPSIADGDAKDGGLSCLGAVLHAKSVLKRRMTNAQLDSPWRQISTKTRPQTIHTIAENQIAMEAEHHKIGQGSANSSPGSTTGSSLSKKGLSDKRSVLLIGRKKHKGWSKVRTIGKLANATKTARETAASNIDARNAYDDLEESVEFLRLVNKLLCALYNLKKNSVKAPEALTETALKELMHSDIELDDEGRPKPKVVQHHKKSLAPTLESVFGMRRQSQHSSKQDDGKVIQGRQTKLKMFAFRNKGILTNAVKISKIMKDQSKVATWEDLLVVDIATGELQHPTSPTKGGQFAPKGTKPIVPVSTPNTANNNMASNSVRQPPLWLREDRHGENFNIQAQLAAANDSLSTAPTSFKPCNNAKVAKMRKDFEQAKASLTKELNLELEYRKQQQALLVRNKLLSLELGPIASVSLEKMRRDANKKVKDQQLLTPLQTPAWFLKLERQYEGYGPCRNQLAEIGRFQRYPVSDMCDASKLSSCHDIQQNKRAFLRALDKLCLLMGSLPMNEVLMWQYPVAFQFIIREILGFPDTIYQNWLRLRTSGRLTNYITK